MFLSIIQRYKENSFSVCVYVQTERERERSLTRTEWMVLSGLCNPVLLWTVESSLLICILTYFLWKSCSSPSAKKCPFLPRLILVVARVVPLRELVTLLSMCTRVIFLCRILIWLICIWPFTPVVLGNSWCSINTSLVYLMSKYLLSTNTSSLCGHSSWGYSVNEI